MSEGIFITRTDWNAFEKRMRYLEDYVKNSTQQTRSRWITQETAMDEIGCKKTKLTELRLTNKIEWRYAGNGKGIMILRKSVEDYNNSQSSRSLLKAI